MHLKCVQLANVLVLFLKYFC